MPITAPIDIPERSAELVQIPAAAATHLYGGQLIARDAAGNAVPASDTAGLRVVGRCEIDTDNSAGLAAALSVLVKRGIFRYANSVGDAVAKADIGNTVYVEDDQTICKVGANNKVPAGKLIDIDSNGVWVDTRVARVGQTQDALIDNTTGVASTTLKLIRSDTGAHTAADAADNFATLAAELAKVKADIASR